MPRGPGGGGAPGRRGARPGRRGARPGRGRGGLAALAAALGALWALAGAAGAPGPVGGAALRALGLGAFARGFLLSKAHVPGAAAPLDPRPPPQYRRVVVFVLDAMRWDFVAEPAGGAAGGAHEGALGVFREVVRARGPHAGLFQFEADPPTNTLQRLKGLTAGSLPTFVDFAEAFAAEALPEDSLVAQLRAHGHRLYVVGDDTWEGLFPGLLADSHPFPSLDVQDLDTVDAGVEHHARRELARGAGRREGDWDVFVGHFLGVDHAGHTFNVRHPVMAAKLKQMDAFFRWAVAELEAGAGPGGPFEDTLLLVFGDHGQTLQGEHGGGGFDEAVSGLFAYAVQPASPGEGGRADRTRAGAPPVRLQQLDFAASVSAVLGLPTPFGNLGRLAPELWLLRSGCLSLKGCEVPGVRSGYRDALERNARQVHGYLRAYGGMDLTELRTLFEAAVSEASAGLAWEEHVSRLEAYLEAAAAASRAQWARFDPACMAAGLLVLAAALWVEGRSLVAWFGRDSWDLAAVGFLVALHSVAMLSNSYVMGEGLLVHYFFGTAALLYARECRSWAGLAALLLALAANRAMFCFTARTHSESVTDIFHLSLSGDAPAPPAVHGLLQVGACALALRTAFGRARAAGLRGALFHVVFSVQVVLACLFWVPRTSARGWHDAAQRWRLHLLLPRAVYALCALSSAGVAVERGLGPGERGLRWALSLLPTVALLQGERGLLCLAAGFVQGLALLRLSREVPPSRAGRRSPLLLYLLSLSASQLFFATGHLCQFAALKFNEAFVGFESFHFAAQGILLAVNTWSFHLLLGLFALFVAGDAARLPHVLRALLFPFAANALGAAACACLHRRHLMAYSVFAPKFVFSLAAVLVTDAVALLAAAVTGGAKPLLWN